MIFDFFAFWFGSLVVSVMEMLPTSPVPPPLAAMGSDAAAFVVSHASLVGSVVPFADLGQAIVAVAGLKLAFATVRIIVWGLALMHLAGSK